MKISIRLILPPLPHPPSFSSSSLPLYFSLFLLFLHVFLLDFLLLFTHFLLVCLYLIHQTHQQPKFLSWYFHVLVFVCHFLFAKTDIKLSVRSSVLRFIVSLVMGCQLQISSLVRTLQVRNNINSIKQKYDRSQDFGSRGDRFCALVDITERITARRWKHLFAHSRKSVSTCQ